MTAGGSYSMWNFLELIRKPHSLGVPFLALVSSRGVTHFYGITLAMTFDFSRIPKTNLETSVEYFKRHFFNHPTFLSGASH